MMMTTAERPMTRARARALAKNPTAARTLARAARSLQLVPPKAKTLPSRPAKEEAAEEQKVVWHTFPTQSVPLYKAPNSSGLRAHVAKAWDLPEERIQLAETAYPGGSLVSVKVTLDPPARTQVYIPPASEFPSVALRIRAVDTSKPMCGMTRTVTWRTILEIGRVRSVVRLESGQLFAALTFDRCHRLNFGNGPVGEQPGAFFRSDGKLFVPHLYDDDEDPLEASITDCPDYAKLLQSYREDTTHSTWEQAPFAHSSVCKDTKPDTSTGCRRDHSDADLVCLSCANKHSVCPTCDKGPFHWQDLTSLEDVFKLAQAKLRSVTPWD